MNGSWNRLKSFTDARVALGRSGGSIPTYEMLTFKRDHALARDAVWADIDTDYLKKEVDKISNQQSIILESQAIDRQTFIKRPDYGRVLNDHSVGLLTKHNSNAIDLNIVIADGLSALAIERHAIPFLNAFLPLVDNFHMSPITIVKQGRVAISDEIGALLNSKLVIMLIGERPGLSSPDSMGIYLTYNPQVGNTDEKRNCISNIRTEGLHYDFAANKLCFLVNEAIKRKLSGVQLKDTYNETIINVSSDRLSNERYQ